MQTLLPSYFYLTAKVARKTAKSAKIDQSFVRQISTTPNETTIVTAIISMGRSLKLRVVAEGVETPAELAFLRAHNCDEAQGYYFSRPVLPQQFAKLLETGISETSSTKTLRQQGLSVSVGHYLRPVEDLGPTRSIRLCSGSDVIL